MSNAICAKAKFYYWSAKSKKINWMPDQVRHDMQKLATAPQADGVL
jgi:hypothetical protein